MCLHILLLHRNFKSKKCLYMFELTNFYLRLCLLMLSSFNQRNNASVRSILQEVNLCSNSSRVKYHFSGSYFFESSQDLRCASTYSLYTQTLKAKTFLYVWTYISFKNLTFCLEWEMKCSFTYCFDDDNDKIQVKTFKMKSGIWYTSIFNRIYLIGCQKEKTFNTQCFKINFNQCGRFYRQFEMNCEKSF